MVQSHRQEKEEVVYNRTRPNILCMHTICTELQAQHNTAPWKPMLLGVFLGCKQLAHNSSTRSAGCLQLLFRDGETLMRILTTVQQSKPEPMSVSSTLGQSTCRSAKANALFCLQIQPSTQWFETHHYIFFFFSPHSTCPVPFQEHPGLLKTNIYWILTRQSAATYSKSMGITNKQKLVVGLIQPRACLCCFSSGSVDSLKPCTLGQLASLNGLCVYLRVNVDGCCYFLLSLPTFAPKAAGISTSTPTVLTEALIDGWSPLRLELFQKHNRARMLICLMEAAACFKSLTFISNLWQLVIKT